MSDGFAELVEISDPPTILTLVLADTFELYLSGNNGGQGPLDIIEVEAGNDRIIVRENGGGTYSISLSAQIGADKPSLVRAAVFINDVFQVKLLCLREIGTPKDVGSMSVYGTSILVPNDVVTVKFDSDKANTDVEISHMNLTIESIVRDIVP